MNFIEEIERGIEGNRKLLLYALRENDWKITNVESDFSDWALDQIWNLESEKKNKGYALYLMFFRYDGEHDGMNLVIATKINDKDISPYGGDIDLSFDSPNFSKKMKDFILKINKLRDLNWS